MSQLTNCQINAQIRGLESGIRAKVSRGDRRGLGRRLQKLDAYRTELAARLEVGENPGTEIQTSRNGEGR